MLEGTPANRERAYNLVRQGPIWMARHILKLERQNRGLKRLLSQDHDRPRRSNV